MTTLKQKVAELQALGDDFKGTPDDENVRHQMANLVKQMADAHGLKPRLLFGKGNVKAQRKRYKQRVIEEKRFQCQKCEHIFTSSQGLKHHLKNQICEKPKPVRKCDVCDVKFRDAYDMRRHFKTKRHKKRVEQQ